jgi:uncharacterized protein YcgI (DUF1989 family)
MPGVEVELYETQLAFLDRVIEERVPGLDREAALRWAFLEHIKDRLDGAGAYVGGRIQRDVLETTVPEYGPKRYQHRLEPITGKAVPVHRGEILRIQQTDGGTCVDFNAFNLHDYKEFLDCGFTRSFQSFDPRRGEFIWTNAPRGRPMFAIMEIADTNELDIVGHRCNRVFEDLGWGLVDHANCQDTLAESIREYGLTPDDVHDSFNLWMATTIDENGHRQFKWNPAQPGERLDLLALFDVLAVAVICGCGDLVGINNYTFAAIELEVLEPTSSTNELVDQVERRWGRMASQDRIEDARATPVRAERELKADPSYEPHFRPPPATRWLQMDLSDEDAALIDGLLTSGLYGGTRSEAIRAAFMRWCNRHVTRVRRTYIEFTDGGTANG